jgi:hypothetical protein
VPKQKKKKMLGDTYAPNQYQFLDISVLHNSSMQMGGAEKIFAAMVKNTAQNSQGTAAQTLYEITN